MAEPTRAEVIPKAIVKEALPATPTAGSSEYIAKRINEKVDQGSLAGAIEEARKTPIDWGKVNQAKEQIGIDHDPSSGKKVRNPSEQAHYNEIKDQEALVKKFLEQGYGKLDPSEKGRLQDDVLTRSKIWPVLEKELTPLSPTQRQEYAKRILEDPKTSAEVRQKLMQIADTKLLDATDAKSEVDMKRFDRDDKNAALDDIVRRINAVDAKLAEFERPAPGGGGRLGVKAEELERTKANLPTFTAELHSLTRTHQEANQRVKLLEEERQATLRNPAAGGRRPVDDITRELIDASNQVRNAENQIVSRQAEIGKIETLEKEERDLGTEKQNLEKERRQADLEFKKIDLEFQQKQQKLQDMLNLRSTQEQDLVDRYKNIFADSTEEYIRQQMSTATKEFDNQIEELKQKTTDDNKKAMPDAMRTQWHRGIRVRRWGRTEIRRPIDRRRADEYHNDFMKDGSEAVMRKLLRTRINPRTTGVAYTEAEANEIIADKAFRNEMEPEVAKQLLARKFLSGGMSKEDVYLLTDSEWGRNMIQEARTKNQNFRDAVREHMGEGVIDSPGFMERFRREIRHNPRLLFLLLGALVTLPAVVGVMAARSGGDRLTV